MPGTFLVFVVGVVFFTEAPLIRRDPLLVIPSFGHRPLKRAMGCLYVEY